MARHKKKPTKPSARPTSKYQSAVLAREELSDWLGSRTRAVHQYFDAWRRMSLSSPGTATMPTDITVSEILRQQKRRIDMAEFFHVSTEVGYLIKDASQNMPPHLMVETDFPSSHGFIWLETPMSFSLVEDQIPVLIRAISWARENVGVGFQDVGPGVLTWDYMDTRVARVNPNLTDWPSTLWSTPVFPIAFGSIRDGRVPWLCWDVAAAETNPAEAVTVAMKIPSVAKAYRRFQEDPQQPEDFVPIPPGSEVIKPGTEDGHWVVRVPEGDLIHFEPDHVGRFLQTFCLFLRQELPSLYREPVDMPKPMLQRFRFKGINRSPITLITWRRREHTEYNTDTGRTISYRYIRRAYWKYNNFRKNPDTGERMRYPVYIAPTIVGNPNLPFRDRTIVNKVSR